VKRSREKTYAQEQLANKNDVGSRWSRAFHAASRINAGDGLQEHTPTPPEGYDEAPELSDKVKKQRKARLWGSLSIGSGGGERDEAEVLPYTSKTLEQQHWCVARRDMSR
jgi:hypothetical protein